MLLARNRPTVRTVQKFGITYEVREYEPSVATYVPVEAKATPLESGALEEMAGMIASQGFFEDTDPTAWGYEVRNIYRHDWPSKGTSHIYYHPERKEYLKIPVLVRRGDIQFFAMNALHQALENTEEFGIVAASALIRNRSRGYTCLFFEEASGLQGSQHLQDLDRRSADPEEYRVFEEAVTSRTADLIRCLPRALRPLCNDNPVLHPILGTGRGFQNTFIQAESATDTVNEGLVLIDQAHTTPYVMAHSAVVGRL